MKNESRVYAAYGSNLNLEQMAYRCPYATVIGAGELKDYHLLFRGARHGAVATVEPKAGGSVPVLLWEITPRDEEALDRYEGWPRLYRKETLAVTSGSTRVKAMVYIMNDGRALGYPSRDYLETICDGYESAGFIVSTLSDAIAVTADTVSP